MAYEAEVWTRIPGFSLYEVSNVGRIRSVEHEVDRGEKGVMTYPSHIMKLCVSNAGYLRACIKDDNGIRRQQSVHRAVALAFIPNPENKPEVNHINANKLDNCVENLEWVTSSENARHRDMLLPEPRKMPDNIHNEKAVIIDGKYRFESITEAAEYIGSTESQVCSVLKGRYATTHGHTAEYA